MRISSAARWWSNWRVCSTGREQSDGYQALTKAETLRTKVYRQLEPSAWPWKGLSPVNLCLSVLILIASLSAILETEPLLSAPYGIWFRISETAFTTVFAVEYALRLWSVAERPGLGGLRARVRFVFSPSGLLDLIVVVAALVPTVLINVSVLRLVRLIRIARLAKLGRMSAAMRSLDEAIWSRRYELSLTAALALAVLIMGASALYWLEGKIQPEKFGSVPRAIWWAIITMTTIGYGDVYPVTVGGKAVASLVAIAGIGLIAMPTGILASAFSDAMQRRRDEEVRR